METNVNLPEIGKVYSFFDDGKSGYSRQYLAMVTRIIPIDKAKGITRMGVGITEEDYIEIEVNKKFEFSHTLFDYWKYESKNCDWVFDKKTDYLIECAIPNYDEHLIYFARMKNGGWFSLDIQSSWQGGFLDVNNENDDYLREDLKEKRNKNKI